MPEREMFPHETLHVYGKALAFVAAASAFLSSWDKRHAVVDQLDRASESLLLNLADGARFVSGARKLRALDYALGSCLECVACLDIARIKSLFPAGIGTSSRVQTTKQRSCLVLDQKGIY